MEFTSQQEKKIDLYFHLSVTLKGVISFAEVVVGIIVFFIPISYLADIVIGLLVLIVPSSLVPVMVTSIGGVVQELESVGGAFVALYLLSRGLIKFILIVAVLKSQLWAYPSSLIVLGLFILYQFYQIFVTQSALIFFITVFDLIVMWFIWKEYQILRSHRKPLSVHTS